MTGDDNIPRQRLLDAAVAYVQEHGVADLSLRRLAAEIGTSHRMLIYHFDSKDGLLIAVVHAVEEQQRRMLAGFEVDPEMTPAETTPAAVTRRMWRHLSDPALWPNERLFFEMYGRALQSRPHTAGFLDDLVQPWLDLIVALRCEQGIARDVAEAQARVDLAVTRGLLLDLLATGDRVAVERAMEQYVALFEAWRA